MKTTVSRNGDLTIDVLLDDIPDEPEVLLEFLYVDGQLFLDVLLAGKYIGAVEIPATLTSGVAWLAAENVYVDVDGEVKFDDSVNFENADRLLGGQACSGQGVIEDSYVPRMKDEYEPLELQTGLYEALKEAWLVYYRSTVGEGAITCDESGRCSECPWNSPDGCKMEEFETVIM